ncbi:hypothetical protein [Halosolutus gelatinilyticus]|uniref:hypothetical protein n=1 Tax=Halosolutus gelatinilyticus TaxID=2931975 RepID=UPI001FF3477A|nr:hypothetical protein [Halosolutus gelatinilyticus]
MPTPRRALLAATCGVLPTVGGAGCLSRLTTRSLFAEYLQLKAVSVRWTRDGRSRRDEPLKLLSDGKSEIRGTVASEYAQLASAPADVTVSESVHDRLAREFDGVRYVVGFCGEDFGSPDAHGCRNTGISRDDFNRVQFGDRAEVRLVDDTFRLEDVEEGDRERVREWETDVREYDWEKRRADRE